MTSRPLVDAVGDAQAQMLREARTDDLIARARDLQPLIRERAHQAEGQRCLTADVLAALELAEIFKALTPCALGGLGLGLRALWEVARVVAQADTSTGWVTCFLMEHNWMLCRLGQSAQQRLYANGRGYVLAAAPLAPGGAAERVAGGYRISGKWRYASGIAHAEWTFVCAPVEGDDGPVPKMFLVPVKAITVLDEWHMAGMCATNSTNLTARDLFVPEDMTIALEKFYSATGHGGVAHPEAIYRYPLLPGLLVMLAAVAVGSAEGALTLGRQRLVETAPWGVKRIDRATSRVRWAEAAQDIRCANLLWQEMCRYTLARCETGAEWSLSEQGQLDLDLATVTHLCKNAVAALLDGCGSSTFQLADPLQRHLRDLTVLGSHLGNDRDVVVERGARYVLGLGQLPTDPFAPQRSKLIS